MELLPEYGYFGLFLISFLAATVLPVVAEPFITGMLMAGYDPVISISVATAGNWLGGMSTFGLGYLGKVEWLEKWFRIKHSTAEKFQHRIQKHGGAIAFFSWIPFLGDPLTVALGLFKARTLTVAIFMFLGKAIRYIIWGLASQAGINFFE